MEEIVEAQTQDGAAADTSVAQNGGRERQGVLAWMWSSPIVLGAVATAAFIGIWQVVADLELVSPLLLPGPGEIWSRFVRMWTTPYQGNTLIGHTAASLRVAFTGWGAAAILGLPLGIWVGWSRTARDIVMPIFVMLRPIPPIAWIPFAVIWLGFGVTARSFVVFLSAFFPIVLNSVEAVVSIDKVQYHAAANLGATPRQTFRRIVLPTSLPILLTGGRIALGNAWMTLVAAEMLGATAGLGFTALNARRTLDSDIMFVAMGVLGVFGGLISLGSAWLERKATPWATRFEAGSGPVQ